MPKAENNVCIILRCSNLQDDETEEGELPPDDAMQPSGQPDARRNARQAGDSAVTAIPEAAADSQVTICEPWLQAFTIYNDYCHHL